MQRVGEYLLTRELNSGGQGTTYLAEHEDTGDTVVIKRCGSDGEREAANLVDIPPHKNVVRLRTSFPGLGGYCVVMDYVAGSPLDEVLEDHGLLDVEDWWPYFKQILLGTDHIHRHGLIHQDLKPANIIISGRRSVLVDLGGARRLTGTETVVYTRGYEAPEVHSPLTAVGPYSDIYSLAVLFSEAVLGSMSHRTPAERQEIRRRLGETLGVFGESIGLALMDQPDQRPQTVPEWLAELVATPESGSASERHSTPAECSDLGDESSVEDPDQTTALSTDTGDRPKPAPGWDNRTLATLRDRIANDFKLPRRSISFKSAGIDTGSAAFNTMIGTWCSAWTGQSQLDEPRADLPRQQFVTKNVRSLRVKIEDVYGLPRGLSSHTQANWFGVRRERTGAYDP